MAGFECKECGRTFSGGREELVDKAHDHMHVDHGKHVSRVKLEKRIME